MSKSCLTEAGPSTNRWENFIFVYLIINWINLREPGTPPVCSGKAMVSLWWECLEGTSGGQEVLKPKCDFDLNVLFQQTEQKVAYFDQNLNMMESKKASQPLELSTSLVCFAKLGVWVVQTRLSIFSSLFLASVNSCFTLCITSGCRSRSRAVMAKALAVLRVKNCALSSPAAATATHYQP